MLEIKTFSELINESTDKGAKIREIISNMNDLSKKELLDVINKKAFYGDGVVKLAKVQLEKIKKNESVNESNFNVEAAFKAGYDLFKEEGDKYVGKSLDKPFKNFLKTIDESLETIQLNEGIYFLNKGPKDSKPLVKDTLSIGDEIFNIPQTIGYYIEELWIEKIGNSSPEIWVSVTNIKNDQKDKEDGYQNFKLKDLIKKLT